MSMISFFQKSCSFTIFWFTSPPPQPPFFSVVRASSLVRTGLFVCSLSCRRVMSRLVSLFCCICPPSQALPPNSPSNSHIATSPVIVISTHPTNRPAVVPPLSSCSVSWAVPSSPLLPHIPPTYHLVLFPSLAHAPLPRPLVPPWIVDLVSTNFLFIMFLWGPTFLQ